MLRAFVRTALTLLILSWLFPAVSISTGTTLIIAAIVMTVIFAIGKPFLKLVFLPINIITLGLFSSLISIFLLWLTTLIVPGFSITGATVFGVSLSPFATYIVASLLIGFLQPLIGIFI